MSDYFFLGAEKNSSNADFIDSIESYANSNKTLIYILDRPLTDNKYSYSYNNALILLSSKKKITIINCGHGNDDLYDDFVEDVIEDLSSISDKYQYKSVIGRSRHWRGNLLATEFSITEIEDIPTLLQNIELNDDLESKKVDLMISLFIGSINDINRVKDNVPTNLLDKVKQKIQLFDSDQTRFIYKNPEKKNIKIQGLSGTGKTELLLHKLKDLYIKEPDAKIIFTCHNKILAHTIRRRIPEFFNFMKVEQQIEWKARLWCIHSWGSGKDRDSGVYSYICNYYQIPFNSYSNAMSFDKACKIAIEDIKEKYGNEIPSAFTYMFIDESQDFDDEFFTLCDLATEKNLYIAGDIFQSIFDENIMSSIEPDFLLSKCYRTDSRTLMFAHALGMGLFEANKLRWLEEKEWKDCGYNVRIEGSNYYLSREPLKRFEDLDDDFESIRIVEFETSIPNKIIDIISEIISENKTVKPDDIGIIFLDNSRSIYDNADILELEIQNNFKWEVNKAYESKEKEDGKVLISNRNNVKGLEFPFVICITNRISDGSSYRNSLYTMLTRSFIKSYFLVKGGERSGLTDKMTEGLQYIIDHKEMLIHEPTDDEKINIQTRFNYIKQRKSHYDVMMDIFDELSIEIKYRNKLLDMVKNTGLIEADKKVLIRFVNNNKEFL
ncbi:DEAD/DEAH box helicase [Psychrobacter immobilis]|jgi:superfamily I DNA and RNA helicase|uniref:DEAD/DEAH box helicase n=1 Tax=Psychrobacter immobilis TaxID=498 RepID=UPI001917E265|nr:ATP-binding domain-containing protein [Psychrobacter immobilis]